MKRFGLLLLTAPLAACASGPAPNFFNGNYYLAGDADCKRMTAETSTTVMCYNSKGEETAWRVAMSPEELQAYQIQAAHRSQQVNELTQQLQQTGQAFQQIGQNIQRQSSTYTAPVVVTPAPPGGTKIKCIKAGIYINCRE